jgi:hypothetical protein
LPIARAHHICDFGDFTAKFQSKFNEEPLKSGEQKKKYELEALGNLFGSKTLFSGLELSSHAVCELKLHEFKYSMVNHAGPKNLPHVKQKRNFD